MKGSLRSLLCVVSISLLLNACGGGVRNQVTTEHCSTLSTEIKELSGLIDSYSIPPDATDQQIADIRKDRAAYNADLQEAEKPVVSNWLSSLRSWKSSSA